MNRWLRYAEIAVPIVAFLLAVFLVAQGVAQELQSAMRRQADSGRPVHPKSALRIKPKELLGSIAVIWLVFSLCGFFIWSEVLVVSNCIQNPYDGNNWAGLLMFSPLAYGAYWTGRLLFRR